MSQVTITTEQVHELIEQLAAMTAAASITPEIVANIFEKMRNLNDQEREKVIAVAEAKIAEIQDIGIAADHVTLDSGVTVEIEMQKKAYKVELYGRSTSLPLPTDATYYYKGLPTHSVVGTAYDSTNEVYTDYIGICYEHEPDDGNEPQHHTVMVFVKNNGEYLYSETFNTMEASGYLQEHIARAFGSVDATVSYSGLMSAQDKRLLNNVVAKLDNIDKESTQSEEQAIIYETDGGVQVGKIDSTGADFANLKRGGQQVARMSDLPTVPTLDPSIGSSPSNSHVPSTKAVKDYVDDNIPEVPEYPIKTETAQSEAEEVIFGNDAGTQQYAKVSSEGVKAVAYSDMQGNNVIPVKDTSIGENPSTTNVPTTKAVKDYVDANSGVEYPISEENIADRAKMVVVRNSADSEDVVVITDEGLRAKTYKDMQGNPIGGASVRRISGFNYLVFS